MKTTVNEDNIDKLSEEWYDKAREVTATDFPNFIKDLVDNYQHDYTSICYAGIAAMIAGLSSIDKTDQGGLTGYQTHTIMWGVIDALIGKDPIGRKLMSYSYLAYPDNKDMFEKKIPKSVFENLQEFVRGKLNTVPDALPKYKKHWRSIMQGKVPYGFKIEDDKM